MSSSGLNDLPASAATLALNVTTAADCTWTAASNASFAEIVSGSTGTGNGTVEVRLSENSGAARTASLIIAGSTLTLTQSAPGSAPPPTPPPPSSCTFSISTDSTAFDSAGGSTTISVRVASGTECSWTAVARDSFVSVVNGASGSESGQTTISVSPNAGAARTGALTIAGQTVSLTQAAGSICVTSLSPTTQSVPAVGGTGSVSVTAPSSCAWVAITRDSFISVQSTVKIGDGSFTFTLGANSAPASRSGSVSVGNGSVNITQPAGSQGAAVFSFTSQPRDSIGNGQSRRIVASSPSQFTATIDPARRNISVRMNEGFWQVNLGAPAGGVLAPGLYNATARYPFHEYYGTGPGLDVGGDGSGCNQSMGRFLIAELVVANGAIQRLHAVVEQHCEYRSAAFIGDIWVDAGGSTTVPSISLPTPSSPTSILTMTGDSGDPRLNGQTRTYTIQNAVFQPRAQASQLVINVNGLTDSSFFSLAFSAAGPSRPTVGTYNNATGFASAAAPAVGLDANGVGCSGSNATGSFRILELVYGPLGPAGDQILRFRATFEQHCSGTAPAVRGEVYVVADPWR